MKKQDIKRDLIRDRIISGIHYLSDNSNYVWTFLAAAVFAIILLSFVSNKNNKKLVESNNLVGALQSKAVHGNANNDSLLLSDFEKLIENSTLSKESYNQVIIYLLNHSIKSNDRDRVVLLLDNHKIDSDDNMLNSFILKLKGDIASDNNNISTAISYYAKAVDLVPNYDLMVLYSMALIDLYIENSDLNKANKAFKEIISLTENVDNLPRSTQNNIDFIEYKLKQLNK